MKKIKFFKESKITGYVNKFVSIKSKLNSELDNESGEEFVSEKKLVSLVGATEANVKATLTEQYMEKIENPSRESLSVSVKDRDRLFEGLGIEKDDNIVEVLLGKTGFILSCEEAQLLPEATMVLSIDDVLVACKLHTLQLREKFFNYYRTKLTDGEDEHTKALEELNAYCVEIELPGRFRGRNSVSKIIDDLIDDLN